MQRGMQARALDRPAIDPTRRRNSPRRRWGVSALVLALLAGIALLLRPATPTAYGAPLAPGFTLPLASGGHGALALGALRGHPVLLNFFNTQCLDCIAEMPTLRAMARAYQARGVVVLGIATGGDTIGGARQFARSWHLPYPVVVDAQQSVAWQYHVEGYPASFFVDARGKVQGQVFGPLDDAAVRDGLAQAGALKCSGCQEIQRPAFGAVAAPDLAFSPQPYPAPRFALRDQNGALITPASLRGKVVALTFISAACTEQCPLVGRALSAVRRALGRNGARLSIVAISISPEQDLPATTITFALKSGWLGTDWHYLTAPRSVLQRVWKDYYVPTPSVPRAGQSVVHDAGLYLIDPRGNLRAYYEAPFLARSVTAYVRGLLSVG